MCAIHTHSPERRKNTREKKTFSITTEKREIERKINSAQRSINTIPIAFLVFFCFFSPFENKFTNLFAFGFVDP